jgi:glycosyltransferase involved in cell wall biosynthesis
MRQPTVSVILPAYNSGPFIGHAIESVLQQSFDDLEVIVVDDGSTDGTGCRARAYGERVQYIRRPHLGAGAARNYGAKMARGRWLAFLDADDFWYPHKLSDQIALIRQFERLDVIVSNYHTIEEGGGLVGEAFVDHPMVGREAGEERFLVRDSDLAPAAGSQDSCPAMLAGKDSRSSAREQGFSHEDQFSREDREENDKGTGSLPPTPSETNDGSVRDALSGKGGGEGACPLNGFVFGPEHAGKYARHRFGVISTLLVRAELFHRVGGFDERFEVGEDIHLMNRLVAWARSFGAVGRPGAAYRRLAASVSRRDAERRYRMTIRALTDLLHHHVLPRAMHEAIRDEIVRTRFDMAHLLAKQGRRLGATLAAGQALFDRPSWEALRTIVSVSRPATPGPALEAVDPVDMFLFGAMA